MAGSATPVFASELDAPFERMTPATASALLRELYGLEAVALERLDTERDDSFRVTTADAEFVLKVAHPDDDPAVIGLQTAAVEHAARRDPTLPLQRVVPTLDGELEPRVGGRIARLLTWLPGDLLADRWADDAGKHAYGAALARLDRALEGFEHPAAKRTFTWRIEELPALRTLLSLAPTPSAARVIERFERHVAPRLAEVPHQQLHGDFHPANVLVASDDPRTIAGILDFGDTAFGARVVDVAIAAAYLVPAREPAWAAIRPFIAGYESVSTLTDLELDLLPDLIAARQTQRLLIAAHGSRDRDDAERVSRHAAALDNLLSEE